MTNAYWFKPKRIGYGATPSTWEGWALIAAYSLLLWAGAAVIVTQRSSTATVLTVGSALVIVTIGLFATVSKKTDGRWGWNAGAKQDSGKND
jgi:hypothetical protein